MIARDGDIELRPSFRVPGEFHVLARGVVRFVGGFEAASTVYYDLAARNLSGRPAQDTALRRVCR